MPAAGSDAPDAEGPAEVPARFPDAEVAAALAAFLAAKRDELALMHPALVPVVDGIERRCAEGRDRLPPLAYWAWRGCAAAGGAAAGGAAQDTVQRALAALELLRVTAAAHAVASREPVPAGGGAAPVPAQGLAILGGDLALVWSEELLTTSGLPEATLAEILPLWEAMRTALTARRYLDLLRAAGGVVDGRAAGSPAGWALQLGAALAGADAAALEACGHLGRVLDSGADAAQLRRAVAAAPLADDARRAIVALATGPAGPDDQGAGRRDVNASGSAG